MGYCKSFITLKEIKKPSGKPLRVWAKYKWLFEIFEKILKFTFEDHNEIEFYPFSILSSRTFVILCSSGIQHHFSTALFRFRGDSSLPAGAPDIIFIYIF